MFVIPWVRDHSTVEGVINVKVQNRDKNSNVFLKEKYIFAIYAKMNVYHDPKRSILKTHSFYTVVTVEAHLHILQPVLFLDKFYTTPVCRTVNSSQGSTVV